MKLFPIASLLLWTLTSVPAFSTQSAAAREGGQIASVRHIGRGAGLQAGPGEGQYRLLGTDYGALVGPDGLSLTPYLGARAQQPQRLGLAVHSIERGGRLLWTAGGAGPGAFEAQGLRAERPLGKLASERFEALPEGVELSYLFPSRPAGSGDLVVRLALESSFGLPALQRADRLEFITGSPGQGSGVSIGAVTGIAADGQRVPGSLVYESGELHLTLPEAFVESAAYPLVLDPLVGPVLSVVGDSLFVTTDDYDPDLAFDVTSGQYLAVWERAASATQSRIFARRFDESGNPTSNLFQLSVDPSVLGTSAEPAVANLGGLNSWCVVFRSETSNFVSTSYSIQALLLGNQFSSVPLPTTLRTSSLPLTGPVVGAMQVPDNPIFAAAAATVAWVHEDGWSDLEITRVQFNSISGLNTIDPIEVVAGNAGIFGGSGTEYFDPAIARCATGSGFGGAERFLLTAVRRSASSLPPSSSFQTVGWVVRGSGVQSILVGTWVGLLPNVAEPSVDGLDRQWLVAGRDLSDRNIVARSVRLAADGSNLELGATVDVSSSPPSGVHFEPSVAYSPGKTWIAWQQTDGFRLRGFDSQSLTPAEGPFTLGAGIQGPQEHIAVASAFSGGPFVDNPAGVSNLPSEKALVLWSVDDTTGSSDVLGQALNNTGGGGSYQNLGGGCGIQGQVSFPKPPSIGTSAWQLRIDSLPATTALAFYNLTSAAPNLALPCGACQWMPFEISGSAPLFGSGPKNARLTLTIPAKPSLIGAQLLAQWTLLDPSSTPCPSFPGLSISPRWHVTLGP